MTMEESFSPGRKGKRPSESFREGIASKRARGSSEDPFSSTVMESKESAFMRVLRESGLQFRDKGFHSLNGDQAGFLKKLGEELETSEEGQGIVKEVLETFEDREALERALEPTETDPLCRDARGDYQDSLMYLLLSLEPIQKELFNWLLEKLAEISLEEEDLKEKKPFIRLILNHLKYLNLFEHGELLAKKYLEILDVVPPPIQMEMITGLPEVVDYKEHALLGAALQDMYATCGPDLSSVILDALSNLTLGEEVINELRGSISKTVASTEAVNLPVVVKFILCTSGEGDCLETVLTLREQLDLTPPSSRLSSQSKVPFTGIQISTLEVILSSIMRNKKIGDSWVKAIDSVKVAKEHTPLDLMIIILLMDIPNRQKTAAILFRNKIRSGLFTEELFIKTISSFGESIKKNLPIILDLAEPLISSREPVLNHAGEVLYLQIFIQMDKYCRQEIVAELTTKVSSNTSSRPVSLDILSNIAYNHTDILSEYAIFLSGIMDYMSTMSLDQVRRIMDILSLLAYIKPNETSVIRDDVHIVITKQLGSVNPLMKRMGVIGAVVTIKNMSRNQEEEEDTDPPTTQSNAGPSDSSGRRSLPSAVLRQAKDLLVNVRSMTNKVGEFAGLFMDELASVMGSGSVDSRLGKWIGETMANDFQESFIADVTPGCKPKEDFLPYALLWDLEGSSNASHLSDDVPASIALDLGPMVARSYNVSGNTPKLEVTKAARFIPHFRLLKTCVSIRNKGSLSEIDALLGCAIWFIDTSLLKKMATYSDLEMDVICSGLFYASNWYREVLNAFAAAEDAEYNAKVLGVLKIIVKLRSLLITCLPHNPDFVPPPVLHSIDVTKWKPPSSSRLKKQPRSGKKGGPSKKKQKANLSESLVSQEEDSSQKEGTISQAPSSSFEESAVAEMSSDLEVAYAPFFRELDLDAFHILGYDTLAIQAPMTNEEEEIEDLKSSSLRGPELLLLLKDIYSKLDHGLVARAMGPLSGGGFSSSELKNAGFSNLDALPKRHIAVFGVKIMEYILANMEVISEYYARLIKMSDGIEEDKHSTVFDANTPVLQRCSEFGLKILDKIFNWNGFASRENRPLLKEALAKLASRSRVELNPTSPPKELLESSASYIVKFGETTFCSVGFASALVRLLETLKLLNINGTEEVELLQGMVADVCDTFLKKEWRDAYGKVDKSPAYKKHIEYILSKYLSNQVTTELLEKYIEDLEVVLETGASENYPSFNGFTFLVHFRALFTSLNTYATTITYSPRGDQEEQLESWSTLIHLLYKLIIAVKAKPSRFLVAVVAKLSRVFLSHFIKHGMPMIDKVFKSHRSEVINTLKSLQRVTRFLQHVCSHSKLQNDLNLSNYVPLLKKTLETFVYRVKVTLAYNDCLEAFLMGNLKNRDLKGEEIKEEDSEEEAEEEGEEERSEEDEGEETNEDLRKSLSIEV